MEKYENLGMIGEGSYGMVMKCRHKETSQLVAIKKFLETEEDKMVKKIALREVRMLKQLRHENLVNLIEVFRRKKRLYLVFEFVDHTALDDLEKYPTGADESYVKKVMWQVLKGVEFCHSHNIIHRDVKPENILISKRGVVKLCDFGFARTIAPPGEAYTDYVATRWYRAPELLVGDTNYGRAIDIWAVGSLFSEMLTGEPLFPGESDIDQLYLITKCFGHLIARHREIFSRNPLFIGMRLPEARELEPLERRYPRLTPAAMDIIKWSLRLDPNDRPTCSQLLRHELFTKNGWSDRFVSELKAKIEKEFDDNPLLKNLGVTIYGSVYEAKIRANAEHQKKATLDVTGYYTTGFSSGTDAFASDMEGAAGRKREKKKKIKKELLHQREKAHPERLGEPKHKHSKHPVKKMELTFPATESHHSLTGSQTHLSPLSPRKPIGFQQRNGHDPVLTQPAAPIHGLFTAGVSPKSPLSPNHSRYPHPSHSPQPHPHPSYSSQPSHSFHPSYPSYPPHVSHPSHTPHPPYPPPPHSPHALSRQGSIKSQISITSPPTSLVDIASHGLQRHTFATQSNHSLTNAPGYQADNPSETSLISDRLQYRPSKISPMPDKLSLKPSLHRSSISPTLSPGLQKLSYKKQLSKNKDTVLLPHLKDAERHHAKAATQPGFSTISGLSLASGSQSGVTSSSNRGFLLASVPQSTSLELFKGTGIRPPPTPPTDRGTHTETSTSFPLV